MFQEPKHNERSSALSTMKSPAGLECPKELWYTEPKQGLKGRPFFLYASINYPFSVLFHPTLPPAFDKRPILDNNTSQNLLHASFPFSLLFADRSPRLPFTLLLCRPLSQVESSDTDRSEAAVKEKDIAMRKNVYEKVAFILKSP
jgi:hypothetical protein